MPIRAADLAEEVRETNRRPTDAIDRLSTMIQKLEVRVAVIEDRLGSIRKIGWALMLWAIGMLGSAFYVVHRSTQIEDAVVALQKDFSDMKARDDRLNQTLARIEKSLSQKQSN
jgi:hypothetical protein